MRIATWNVNSLKARLGRVEEWLGWAHPDIVCLQETKLADTAFPALAFESLGYRAIHCGEGRWNGVAILSRDDFSDVKAGFDDGQEPDSEARLLTARTAGITVMTVYVPNGRAVGHEHYHYKLAWLARLRAHVAATARPEDPLVVCGDFNIAPDDRDVWDPAAVHGGTHVSEPERAELAQLQEWGLTDVFRLRYDEGGLFSWWDYRAGDFHQGRGMRIDLVLATKPLAERVRFAVIDRNARKGSQPSDHAPVLVDFDFDATSGR